MSVVGLVVIAGLVAAVIIVGVSMMKE